MQRAISFGKRGYPLYEPQVDALSDGGLLLTTNRHFDSTGTLFPKLIIARTDPQGDIQGCPTFPSCLENSPLVLELGTFEAQVFPSDTQEQVTINTDTEHYSFSDFSDIPPPPTPAFVFPDSLCRGDSASTAGTNNALAHRTAWRLTGNGLDVTWTDSLSFGRSFPAPGQYTLEQSVWFLGCRYDAARTVTVLDSLTAVVEPSGTICDLPPVMLHVNAGRPLTSYHWGTHGNSPTIEAVQNGNYTVTVSDGYCTATGSADVNIVALQLAGSDPLKVPPDASLCPDELPFLLYPASDFSQAFFLNHEPVEGIPIELDREGRYLVGAEIGGCLYVDTFFLSVKDCGTAVYLPNAFSPNGDGINDTFFPQGKNFLPIELSIYDRWGGRVFQGRDDAAVWDGDKASAGVYVYVLAYFDMSSQKVVTKRGTVHLLR